MLVACRLVGHGCACGEAVAQGSFPDRDRPGATTASNGNPQVSWMTGPFRGALAIASPFAMAAPFSWKSASGRSTSPGRRGNSGVAAVWNSACAVRDAGDAKCSSRVVADPGSGLCDGAHRLAVLVSTRESGDVSRDLRLLRLRWQCDDRRWDGWFLSAKRCLGAGAVGDLCRFRGDFRRNAYAAVSPALSPGPWLGLVSRSRPGECGDGVCSAAHGWPFCLAGAEAT